MKILKHLTRDCVCFIRICYNFFALPNRGLSILMYHSIVSESDGDDLLGRTVSKERFQEQMSYLVQKGYNVISLADGVSALKGEERLPRKAICITFDDGYEDNYSNAYPVLEKYNLPATIFVISSYVKEPRLFEYLLEHGIRAMSLTREQVTALNDSNLVTLGFHGQRHVRLATLKDEQLEGELEGGMSELLNAEIKTSLFAYPYGGISTFNEDIIDVLKKQGIFAACTTVSGCNYVGDSLFHLKRVFIGPDDDLRTFREKLVGSHKWNVFLNECICKLKAK